MNFVAIFINRPVFTYVIFLISLIIGGLNFYDIPVEEEPVIPNNTYYIRANYSSSLDGIEHNISQPLERGLLTIPGVELVTSDISHTGCLMQVIFAQDSTPYENLLRIQDAILGAKHEIPSEAIITTSDNSSNAEGIMTLYFVSNKKTIPEISTFLNTKVKNMIESINGVSSVSLRADEHDSYTVEIIPQNMYMFDVAYRAINNVIQNIGITGSSCQIPNGNSVVNINIGYEDTDIESYPIINQSGHSLALKDVSFLNKKPRKKDNIARINGKEAATLEIQKKPDARLIQVCDAINNELIKIKRICDMNDIQCGVIMDKSEFVVRGIHGVYKAIFEAIILVCIVIFLFLRSLKLALIPILAIPLSIIPMFSFMKLTGTTINVYSLFGIVLAIGLVVDDAIVVIENIHKFIIYGYETKKAAIIGTQKIMHSIIAMTITLAIVYMPIFFVNDKNIKSFIDFVITITISVLISGVVALTITPTLFNQLYGKNIKNTNCFDKKQSWWNKINFMKTIETYYLKSLSLIIKYRYSVFLVIYCIVIFATLIAYKGIKYEETIEVDRGAITFGIHGKKENDIEVEYIDKQLQTLTNKIKRQPFSTDISDITTNVSETMKGNDYLRVKLKPHNKRKYSIDHIIKETLNLFRESASDCGIYTSLGTSNFKNFELFLQVYESGYDELQKKYNNFINDNKVNKLINSVLCTDIKHNIAYKLLIDKHKCAKYNVQPVDIMESLTSINQHKFFRKSITKNIHKLYINTLSPETHDKLNDVLNIPIEIRYFDEDKKQNIQGVVPVKNFVKVIRENDLNRKMSINGINGMGIQVRLNSGVSKTEFYHMLNKFNETQDGSFYIKTDIKEERKIKAMQKTISIFLIAIILIYLVLSALFESFIAPFSIMLTVPGSALGSLIMLIIFKQKLNIVSVIGLITLVGLITKHGIMLVDYISSNKDTLALDCLILEASINRLKPILMTTICMIIGSIPLINKHTEFNEYKVPIGLVLVGGMSIGTILTLYVVPCMYLIVDEIYNKRIIKRENYNEIIKNTILNHYNDIQIENPEEEIEQNNQKDNNKNNNKKIKPIKDKSNLK